MEKASSATPIETPQDDPLLCVDCGATPDVINGGKEWRCLRCYCGGVILDDGYLAVAWRYAGLHVGGNASM